jgi:DNA repair photolyase
MFYTAAMSVQYIETTCKAAVNRVAGGMPFALSLNPYRGCLHGCSYCYARASHAYLGHDAGRDFEEIVYVKTNIAAVLRAELARGRWTGESIAIGTATDPYQPIEGRYRLMRGCLAALVDAGQRASITTKGTLVVRDVDLLSALAQRAGVGVNISLITLDDAVWRALEPGAPPPRQRLRALARLAAAGVPVGLALAPVLPGLTDHPADLAAVVRAAADHGAQWLWSGALHLEPAVRDVLLAALEHHFPASATAVARVFGPAGAPARARYTPRWQADALRQRVDTLKRIHGLVERPRPQVTAAAGTPAGQLALPLEHTDGSTYDSTRIAAG